MNINEERGVPHAAGVIAITPPDARLGNGLGFVKADASQIEQVIVNLVLNARDAMPTGGHVTIETSNVELTEELLETETLTLPKGQYVKLAIADTGVGMDEATRAHAFEPFFTTKAKGKGTGWGGHCLRHHRPSGGASQWTRANRGTGNGSICRSPPRRGAGTPRSHFATEGTETRCWSRTRAIREISARRFVGADTRLMRRATRKERSVDGGASRKRHAITEVCAGRGRTRGRLLQQSPASRLYMSAIRTRH